MATIRYLVNDVDEALKFYVELLGFEEGERWGPPFAIVTRGDLSLWLSGPGASAAQSLPDGAKPQPGGWNRLVIAVDDIDGLVEQLQAAGATFRNQPLNGPGGTQVLIEDPSGNPIEIFQPR